MLTSEPVEPHVRICYPSLDMAGVGKHVKNGQGNHHITFQAKVWQPSQKIALANFKDTPSRKYSKSAARASGLHEMYRILGIHSTHACRTSCLHTMPDYALLPTPSCYKGADQFLPQLYVSAHRCLLVHLLSQVWRPSFLTNSQHSLPAEDPPAPHHTLHRPMHQSLRLLP